MGCLNSRSFRSDLKMNEALNVLNPTIHVMLLTYDDIMKIRKCFNKMDKTRDGFIYINEFRHYLQVDYIPFTQKILKMCCCGCPEHLQFGEFLMMCWTYCTLDRAGLGNHTINPSFFLSIVHYLFLLISA